jgi:hypothetical protein
MKIYLPVFKLNDIEPSLIKEYLVKSEKKELLWSDEGIFEIRNNVLYKKTIIDDINNDLINNDLINDAINKIDNLAAVFDESTFEETEWFQIPPSHFNQKLIIQHYQINNSLLQLVIEYETSPIKQNVRDFYFILKNKSDLENSKDDMNTFLLRLNLCN